MSLQYDLFESPSDLENLRLEIKQTRESSDKVRRGLFARHNELAKMYISLKDELDATKMEIMRMSK